MTFDELPLYEAIYDVVEDARNSESSDSPGSDAWIDDMGEARCREIQCRLPIGAPFSQSQMMTTWVKFRKAKNAALTVEVARAHGRVCFYRGRGKGECSGVINLDRIIPGSEGGKYTVENCMVACGRHNVERQDKSIEDYLA